MVFLWTVGCDDVDIPPLLVLEMLNLDSFAWVPDFKLDEGQLKSPVISQGFGGVCQRALQASSTRSLLNVQLTHLSAALTKQMDSRAARILSWWGGVCVCVCVKGGPGSSQPFTPSAVSEEERVWTAAHCHGGMLISPDTATIKERSTVTRRVNGSF